MSEDQMIEQYSKRWKVSPEEAKKKIQSFLAETPTKGVSESEGPTGLVELLGDPASPVARKVMGINQALMATAYTKKMMKGLNAPPKEIEGLQNKMESLEKNVGQALEFLNTTVQTMHDDLEARKAEDERKKLLGEMSEIIQPLKEQIAALEKAKSGESGELVELTTEKILAAGQEATEKAQKLLQKMGYDVKMPKGLTIEQVEAKIKETMNLKKKEWEEKSGAQVEVEKERIKATEEILTGVVDRVFNIFLEPLKDEIHKAIKKGAFGRGRPP